MLDIYPLVTEFNIDFYKIQSKKFNQAFHAVSFLDQHHGMLPAYNLTLLNFSPSFLEKLKSYGGLPSNYREKHDRMLRHIIATANREYDCTMLFFIKKKVAVFSSTDIQSLVDIKYKEQCSNRSEWEDWLDENRNAINIITRQIHNKHYFFENLSLAIRALGIYITPFSILNPEDFYF
jgi:hypothetical protein